MAYEKGIANNVADLLLKLETFLTTNTQLVAAGQQWESLKDNIPSPYTTSYDMSTGSGDILPRFFKGKGLDGKDDINVSMGLYFNKGSDTYNLYSYANKNYDKTKSVKEQYGSSDWFVACASWANAVPYWFIANGRRFIVITKVANRYMSMYCGFILPSGIDTEYPYPLFVGGNHGDLSFKYTSDLQARIRSFFNPIANSQSTGVNPASLYGFAPDYIPIPITNASDTATPYVGRTHPYYPRNGVSQTVGKTYDGEYVLESIEITQDKPVLNVLGWFDGVYYVTGYENSPETIIKVNGIDYLCIPAMIQNDYNNYAAFKLM